jgi:hypothetical protein
MVRDVPAVMLLRTLVAVWDDWTLAMASTLAGKLTTTRIDREHHRRRTRARKPCTSALLCTSESACR